MKGALESVLNIKSEIVIITRRLQEKQSESNAIAQDQTRLRENLRALGKGDEEKQLIQRYVAKLAQGEDQLEKLRSESKTLAEERRVLQQRLDDQVLKLSLTHRLRQ
jgi:DNA repair exonuclease SbcCD ATPase subunit